MKCGNCYSGIPGPGCEFFAKEQTGDRTWRNNRPKNNRQECELGCGCEVQEKQNYKRSKNVKAGEVNCIVRLTVDSGQITIDRIMLCADGKDAQRKLDDLRQSGDQSYWGMFTQKIWIEDLT